MSDAVNDPSLAVTWISKLPEVPAGGVPVKARAVALKLSQLGSALPFDSFALNVSRSPSTSVKLLAGIIMLTGVADAIFTSGNN